MSSRSSITVYILSNTAGGQRYAQNPDKARNAAGTKPRRGATNTSRLNKEEAATNHGELINLSMTSSKRQRHSARRLTGEVTQHERVAALLLQYRPTKMHKYDIDVCYWYASAG